MNGSRLKLWRLWRRLEKPAGSHAEPGGQLAQNCDMHAPLAMLVSRDCAFWDPSEAAQILLGELPVLPPFSQVQPRLDHPASIASVGFRNGKGDGA